MTQQAPLWSAAWTAAFEAVSPAAAAAAMMFAAASIVAVALLLAPAVAAVILQAVVLLQTAARVSAAVLAGQLWAVDLFQIAQISQDLRFCALIAASPLQWHLPGHVAAVVADVCRWGLLARAQLLLVLCPQHQSQRLPHPGWFFA
jgi:hypothetical protein